MEEAFYQGAQPQESVQGEGAGVNATEGDEQEHSRQAYCKGGEENIKEAEEW